MIEPATYAATVQTLPNTDDQLLLLDTGGAPQTVYISLTGTAASIGVAFSLTSTGTAYPDGMKWPVDAEYALFVNFVFLTSTLGTIDEVQPKTPGFWVSEAVSSAPSGGCNQQTCTQDIPGTYNFRVSITPAGSSDAIYVDPKIVVTPL